MKKISKYLVVLMVSLSFLACGDSDSGDSDSSFPSSTVDSIAPVFISNNNVSVSENQTSALTLSATDENSISYSISGGDSASFNINSTSGVVTFKTAPDYETKSSYSFTAKASDGVSESTQNVTINIIDKDEIITDTTAPVFILNNNVSVSENQTSALTLSAIDENSISYSISGGDSASFNINSTSGVVTFKTAPDYETKSSYSFTVKASDGVNENMQNVTITITDVDESSSFSSTIKKTGQTKSYDVNGDEVTEGSLKDDGYYQSGVTPDYTRASDIVTDELTGLMWQDNADVASVTKQWLTDANYATCLNDTSSPACYDTSGDTAATYCSDLDFGGYTDWRLPTSTELEGIVYYGKTNPTIDITYFNNVSSSLYWSSTTHDYKYNAWIVGFFHGQAYGQTKDYNYYVRCVRDGE